jgi:eukaryotic-like serine/threonine-protein kinase
VTSGSLNGTYVNGVRIGRRRADQTPEEAAAVPFPEHDLREGDDIRLGNTVLRIGVRTGLPRTRVLVRCARCDRDVGDEVGARAGEYVCAKCRAEPTTLVRELLSRADAGEADVASLAGYVLERELGAGGMGRVYLAREVAIGTRVALKTMLPAVAADPDAQARFLREIDVMRTLVHPGVARLYHAGSASGVFFFTSEYCPGGSLADLLVARGGTLPVDESVPLALQALDALEYAHAQGIVHRDLTPGNILLTAGRAPCVKLADFGLAKLFDQAGLSGLTRTGTAAGKPNYMPYQQIVNFRHARPAVDVWALAACLYKMLTGTSPRDFPAGRDPWQIVLQTDAVPVRRRVPGLPDPLAQVIDTALRDRPDIGYGTATELRRALAAIDASTRR